MLKRYGNLVDVDVRAGRNGNGGDARLVGVHVEGDHARGQVDYRVLCNLKTRVYSESGRFRI